MQHDDVLEAGQPVRPGTLAGWRDDQLLKIAAAKLASVGSGRLQLTMPSGRTRTIGPGGPIEATLRLKSLAAIWRAMMRGGLGFAEAYINGDVETDDLPHLARFYLDNYAQLADAGSGVFETRLKDKIGHKLRSNTKRGSRRNIAAHYDLGNSFYELWLDPGMTYSSALFEHPGMSLDEAQDAKYAHAIAALELVPGQDMLEIGCGWGGMAERLARAGARVTGITVSNQQLAYAQKRIAEAGLDSQARIVFRDYRDQQGQFDGIVSIEMIEAVGEEHWPVYFRTLSDRLKPGGQAVVQAITLPERDFALYRSRPDFIQRYIFPGGMLPTRERMEHHAEASGLSFETVEMFGQSYARTLNIWRQRFDAAWPAIEALGFNERFRRMWTYYLVYCEVAFEKSAVDVGLYRFRKAR